MKTIADALREEGRKEGLRQGALQVGREMLIGLLRDKFGRVPRQLQRQIKAIDDSRRLQAAIIRLVRTESLDAFQL